MSGVVIGTNTITIDGKFLETGKYNTLIQDPSSSPSVPITNIDTNYKYMSFTNDAADITYNFTNYTQLEMWVAYANTIPNTETHFEYYNYNLHTIYMPLGEVGYFQIVLPSTHNYLEITWGNAYDPSIGEPLATTSLIINGVVVDSITDVVQTKTYIYNYTGTPTVRVEEGYSLMNGDIVIKLGHRKTYSVVLPEGIQLQLLLLDSTKYREISQFTTTNSTFELIVGGNGVITSFDGADTGVNGTPYGAGFVSNITGANITYNSSIAIVRYKYTKAIQWTYSSSNPNVYLLGNVGIGTTNPTSALQVLGSVQINGDINSTTLTSNAKNFKIAHPLNLNKWLYHGCVEAPRFDNIYRGKKLVINGTCEVDIDEECNTTGGLTKGTFVSLNTNFSLYVRNNQTYDKVYGIINGSKLTINCQNIEDIIEVDWLVMGERKDENIIINELTNYNGSLICEYDKDQ